MQRYYLDTCIWIDYLENREDRFRPLGEWALRLIKQIVQDEDVIVYSELVIKEIKEMMTIVPHIFLEKIISTNSHWKEANKLAKKLNTPIADKIHVVIAKEINAIIVTRDKHFYEFQTIGNIKRAEDLLYV
jgi:predicted nucleic acid-binding protein